MQENMHLQFTPTKPTFGRHRLYSHACQVLQLLAPSPGVGVLELPRGHLCVVSSQMLLWDSNTER